jgi:benzoate/toluate 1,2-dioxygenase reductase component
LRCCGEKTNKEQKVASHDAATAIYSVSLTGRQWLTGDTFELSFNRPSGFTYLPGQKVAFSGRGEGREYTLLGPPHAPEMAICVRWIPNGIFTPLLAEAPVGAEFQITAATGFFTFKPTSRRVVLIATGTGIAPFVAFARAGARGFDLLHGVRTAEDLYYRTELAPAAGRYIPCISGSFDPYKHPHAFAGHVDACLAERFEPDTCDFYLCGRTDMIRDVIRLIDRRHEGSAVFTEAFF